MSEPTAEVQALVTLLRTQPDDDCFNFCYALMCFEAAEWSDIVDALAILRSERAGSALEKKEKS